MGTDRRVVGAFGAVLADRPLSRLAGAYALFIVAEYGVWAAMLAYAYGRGGARTAGLVAILQLIPAALLAPPLATLFAARRPVGLLVGGYLAQGAGMAVTALGVVLDAPVMAYGAAVVASVAVCATRPAQSVLVPRFAVDPDRLTAANVVLGWVESGGILVAGLLVGALITMDGVSGVFLTGALLTVLASCLVVTLSPGPETASEATSADGASPGPPQEGHRSGVRMALADPRVRPLVALLGAQGVVIGALDLLFVVLAVDSLDRGLAWVGFLNSAYGLGAVLAGFAGALLVGRNLGRPIVIATLLLSGALVALTAAPGVVGTVLLLAGVGGCRCLIDVAGRTMLQRTLPTRAIGPVFGLIEGLLMAGLAAGSLLVPVLVNLGGAPAALWCVAGAFPVVGLTALPLLRQRRKQGSECAEAHPTSLFRTDLHVPDQATGDHDQAALLVLQTKQRATVDG